MKRIVLYKCEKCGELYYNVDDCIECELTNRMYKHDVFNHWYKLKLDLINLKIQYSRTNNTSTLQDIVKSTTILVDYEKEYFIIGSTKELFVDLFKSKQMYGRSDSIESKQETIKDA